MLRPSLAISNTKIHFQYIVGFTSNEGCFKVSVKESKLYKTGKNVVLLLVRTQYIREKFLLKSLVDYFQCDQTYSYKDSIEFRCQSFKDIYEKILSFFSYSWYESEIFRRLSSDSGND